ncbi:YceI family protein [Dyadobacter crusticola]|uniref:YceI family protein n=1 Tax=Dyadobacter crusticola TaxID=292407 RepID=UPI0004E227A8|nr:YceI family protein [Dyadobacter crusticola]
MKNISVLLILLAFCSFTFLIFKDWQIAEGYTIRFDGKYARGKFNQLSGHISFDPASPESAKFDVTVDVNSIDTGIELKNKHAKSEKWFDAEQFPTIRFASEKVFATDSGYVVEGDLTVRGIVKRIAIPFIFKSEQPGFYGTFKVNRGDFGIGKVNGKESDSTIVEVSVPVIPR